MNLGNGRVTPTVPIMLDSRFPTVERFDRWRGSSARTRSFASEVASRTGTNAIVNVVTGRVVFRFGESGLGGPFAVCVRDMERWTSGDVDAAVHVINYQRNAGRTERDRELARQAKAERYENEKSVEQVCEDARPDALDHAAYLRRSRRGTRKTISVGPA